MLSFETSSAAHREQSHTSTSGSATGVKKKKNVIQNHINISNNRDD